ncbi:MAG: ATP-binding cassette domain-containing protein [Spirochaetaceae bacterium]|jgi:ABC-2 type transport system ATP-binding protein|nr:ATP-binding cassette domain-containing protein [Spirochaetaceae bacterium]
MIEVHNLAKKYGNIEAVKDITFTLPDGQILGFLGPNGAGKTTIMKILTGFHYPSSGEALIDGISTQDNPVAIKQLIGYLPENVPLYGDLTINEYLNFIADTRNIPKEKRKNAINAALEQCALTQMANRRIETLSKGYKQRTGLAQSIIHDPPILILDEPTTGLDPNQIIEIRNLIKDLGQHKTIILSTHILQEVEAVCTQVLILNAGHIAAQGSPSGIASSLRGGESWTLTLKGAAAPDTIEHRLRTSSINHNNKIEISNINTTTDAANNNTTHAAFVIPANDENAERIFNWAISLNLKILEMSKKKISLEDIFVKLTNSAQQNEAQHGK